MDRFKIKALMVIFLILDSFATFVKGTPFFLHYPGRVVMPVAIFLVVNGYFYTSSKRAYLKRLLVSGELMLIGNLILSLILMRGEGKRVLYSSVSINVYLGIIILGILAIVFLTLNLRNRCLRDKHIVGIIFILSVGNTMLLRIANNSFYILRNNMFLALAGILLLVMALDNSKKTMDKKSLLKVLVIFAVCILTETVIIGPAFALILYVFKNNKKKIITGLFVISGLFIPGFSMKALLLAPQWMMFFGIIFILLYNEREGLKIKKPFYVIYPLAIWIPFIIGCFIG